MSTSNRHTFSRCLSIIPPSALPCAALLLGLVACDQDKPNCIATTNPFAVKLIELSRTESAAGACSMFGPASFNALPEIGLSPYYQPGSDGQPDYDLGSLAVQTAELGALVFTAADFDVLNGASDGALYSLGPFNTEEPDANDLCTVPTLSLTHVVLAEVPAIPDDPATEDDESFPGQPAVDVALDWSNVQVYVTADTFGTQMAGDLVDTRLTPTGDSCSIAYRALGLAPAIPCGATDEEGNPIVNPDGTFGVDPSLCDPEANPAEGRLLGSGISPSARYECDPVTAFCVVQGESFPALR
jgi:hypothetical protein